MKQNTLDMTTGRPLGLLIRFSLPLMLANVFQQMYTVVDTAIVGKALGVDALAAIGASDWLNWMMYGMVQGLAQGFSIIVAQAFGARDHALLRRAIGGSIVLGALSAVVLLVILQLAIGPVLSLLRTPEAISPSSTLYLRVIFSGIPIIMAYNVFASTLRSLGDSKMPLLAMIFASLLNIGLDLLFVLVFHWGIAGAAIATLIAQAFAALLCLYQLLRISEARPKKADFRIDLSFAKRLLKLGFPLAFQGTVICVGGMLLQFVVNSFSVAFIAGYTASNKLYGILEMAAAAFGFSMLTFTGQNLGAGKLERIRQGRRTLYAVSIVVSVAIAATMILFGKLFLSLFISGTPEEVLTAMDVGYEYLRMMSLFLPVLYILYVDRYCIQGLGNTVLPMVSGIAEFVMRTGSALLLTGILGGSGIFWAEVLAWTGADLILIPSCTIILHKLYKKSKTAILP